MGNNPLEVNIECVYSATTREVTNPRLSHKISVPKEDDHNNHKILQNRMHIILFYEKNKKEEDSGLYSGGWIRQSLGNALMEKPILAGRFRRSENGDLEIISNDSGVRCVEVRVPLTMVEFLELKKNNKFDGETKLVSWNHVDASNPLFSPLFYIQITNFQCGGYSIGISFSLLLVDPLTMTKFLKEWAKIHTSWIYENEFPKKSLFYTQDCKWMGCYQPNQSDTSSTSNSYNKISKTLIFNIISDQKINSRDDQTCKYLVSLCLKEAKRRFLNEINSINYFTLIIKEESGGAKVEITSNTTDIHASERSRYEIKSLNWEDLKINEVVFHKNNELVDVSQWIACDDTLEGVVQVVISPHSEDNSGIKVYITFPCDK